MNKNNTYPSFRFPFLSSFFYLFILRPFLGLRQSTEKSLLFFWALVLLMHAILPVHSDLSALAVISLVAGIYATVRSDIFAGAFWTDLSKLAIGGMFAFDFYVIMVVISAIAHPETLSASLQVLVWVSCVASGFLLSRLLPKHNFDYFSDLFIVLLLCFLSMVAVALYGFVSTSGGELWPDFLADLWSGLWHDGRLKLYAIHPSRLALCASPLVFWASSKFLRPAVTGEKRNWLFFWAGLALVLGLLIVVLSNTRSMILALPVGFFVLALLSPPKARRNIFLVFLLFSLALGAVATSYKDSFINKRIISVITNPMEDPTFKTRLPIWEAGWDSFLKSPWIGNGVKSYRKLHREYIKEHKEELDEKYEYYEKNVKQAHNVILGRLVETGLPGGFAFVFFYTAAIITAWRFGGRNSWIAAFLVFYITAGMLDDGLFRTNDAFVLFAAGAALGFGRSNLIDSEKDL